MTETKSEDDAVWQDLGKICGSCGFNGKHLVVDGSLYYCGRCRNALE